MYLFVLGLCLAVNLNPLIHVSCEHAPVFLSHRVYILPTVLVGTIAAHSSDVHVIGRIFWVHDTRRAGHNECRVLTERIVLFPESKQSTQYI